MMQSAYLGESFELEFQAYDKKDESRVVDRADVVVRSPSGAIVQSSAMSIDSDGHTMRFRFEAQAEGVNEIIIHYTMGLDKWISVHMMDVRPHGGTA